MKRLWRALELLAWTAFFAFAALVLALRFWILPGIEHYRPDIVAAATRSLGTPVKIGGIEAGWLGLRPQVTLYDVRIQDAQGQDALVLPVIDNVVAWRSLLAGGLRLHSLAIDGLRLSVRRDATGTLHVAGMKLAGGGGASDQRIADWVLDQSEIVVRNAEIEWIDEKRGAAPLALSNLDFRLRNSGSRHSIGLSARPPVALGSGLEVRAELSGRSAADLAEWNGRTYVELGYTDLAGWRPWVDYPIDLRRGQGALRLWSTVANGAPTSATADVQLTGVEMVCGQDLPPLELASVSGRIQATSRKGGYEVSGRKLAIVVERGPAIEPSDFRVEWTPEGQEPEHGAVSAKVLDLAPLAQLTETLPFSPEVRKVVAELAPRGRLLDARFDWSGPLPKPAKLAVRTRFADLAINARGEVPGFSGLSGSIEANETHGNLQLASRKAELAVPRVLSEPVLPLESLAGRIDWERKGESAFSLHSSSLTFANADLEGKASVQYAYSGDGPGTIDLTASASRATAARLPRYLPTNEIMGKGLHDYLAAAVIAGESRDVRVRLKGDLRDFPFVDRAKGEFQVIARVEKGSYEYVPGWPRIHDIDAELLFEGDRMEISTRSASILGAKASNVRVAIPAMLAPHVRIEVNGQADGPTSEFMKYIESSPVQQMIGGATDGMIAAGRGKLRLKLEIPIDNPPATQVAGDFEFVSNNVIFSARLPPIERATGRLSFSESGFNLHDITGRIFGGPVTISGGTRRKAVEVLAKGDAQVTALRPYLDHPWRRHLSGAASYTAAIAVRDGRMRVNVDSALRGVVSDLPPPFAKRAPETLKLHVEYLPFDSGARDTLTVTLGQLAVAEVLRRRQGDAMAVQRAAIWLSPGGGQPPRLPERPGTLIYGSLASFDFDRWKPYLDESETTDAGGGAPASSPAKALALELKIGTLDAFGKRVNGLNLRAGIDAGGWSATLQSEEITGDVSYRESGSGELTARLTSLRVPEDYPAAKTSDPEKGKQLPAVDLIAERFIYHDKNFGRVEMKAERVGDEWHVNKLAMASPEASVTGTLVWRSAAPARTSLNFNIEAADAGGLLVRLGYPGLVLGGKARMQAAVGWSGDPNVIDYPTLSGDVQLQAESGQFLKVDAGNIGKLISLMSLQSIPRRLSFDFRDLFEKGFAFDKIRSSGHIDNGLMTLNDFSMEGSSADVEMTGQVDLAKETQKLKLRVVPSLGDTAAVALVLVNPLLIFPAAIAQRILKDPLGHIFAFNYNITGSWAEPEVVKGKIEAQPVKEMENP
jgi:uncharacterized protein (TIGR02099 family)